MATMPVDHLTTLNAAAANGGVLPDHLKGTMTGMELRGGQVIDPSLTQSVETDAKDVFGRVVGGVLHLFDGALNKGQKDALDTGVNEPGSLEGFLGTIDGYRSTVGFTKPLPSGGADGFHPDAALGDVIQPTEGNVVSAADQLRTAPVKSSGKPAVEATKADAQAASVAGEAKADASTAVKAEAAANGNSQPAADKTA